jgi:hypothetical protein
MAERTTRTKEIVLGDEVITGKRSDSRGKLIEPTAYITVQNKDVNLVLEKDVGKIKPTVNITYREATEQEDVAHFLLEILDSKGKVIKEAEITSKELRARFDKLDGQLSVELDVEPWSDKTIHLKTHLRCWLEESGWTPRGGGKETVSDEDFVNITLDVPKIKEPKQSPIVSLNVIGRGLRKGETQPNYEQQDIGKEYRIVTLVHNTTGNTLNYGELDIYENNETARELSQGIKETNSNGIYSTTIKRVKSWQWKRVKADGRITLIDVNGRFFSYKLKYYLRDDFGFDYKGTINPSSKTEILVSVPRYKIDAVGVYNDSFDAESEAEFWSLVLDAVVILGTAGVGLVVGRILGGIAGAAAGAGSSFLGMRLSDTIAKLATGKTVKELTQELRAELMNLINDPPKFDKNYKRVAAIKPRKVRLRKPRDKYDRLVYNVAKSSLCAAANLKNLRITVGRAWSAAFKKDKTILKKQKSALRKFRNKFARDLKLRAKVYSELAELWKKSKIKINRAEFLAFKDRVRRAGLPSDIKVQLRKRGFSAQRIKKVERLISSLRVGQLGFAKTYKLYSNRLEGLAGSIKDFGI